MFAVRNNELLRLEFQTPDCTDEGKIDRSIGFLDVCVAGDPPSNVSNPAASTIMTLGADPSQIILSHVFQDGACEIGPSGPYFHGFMGVCAYDDHRSSYDAESQTFTECWYESHQDGRIPYEMCGLPLRECRESPLGTCYGGSKWYFGSSLSSMGRIMHPDDIKIQGRPSQSSSPSSTAGGGESINDHSSAVSSLRVPIWSMIMMGAAVLRILP